MRLQAFLEKKIQESCNDTTESTNEQILDIGDEKVRQESCADIVEMDLNNSFDSDPDFNSLSFHPAWNSTVVTEKNKAGDKSKSPFSEVEILLQRIVNHCPGGPLEFQEEITDKERTRVWTKDLIEGRICYDEDDDSYDYMAGVLGGEFTGFYVKKEIFDGLDDPFVYKIYLDVLNAQAQFETIFNRPWGSESPTNPEYLSSFTSENYEDIEEVRDYLLLIPFETVENVRRYLHRRRRPETKSSSSF